MKRWLLGLGWVLALAVLAGCRVDSGPGAAPDGACLLGGDLSGYSAQTLEGYLGCAVDTRSLPDSTPQDQAALAQEILQKGETGHLVWILELEDAEKPELGDQRLRDIEQPGPEADIAGFGTETRASLADAKTAVAEVRKLCEKQNVKLTLILSPVHVSRWESHREGQLRRWMKGLARAADFWDFSLTALSYDDRYFYDAFRPRRAVGDLVFGAVFGDGDCWRPENFGTLVTRKTCADHLDRLFEESQRLEPERYTAQVSILMYHHLADPAEPADTTVTPGEFRHQMELLQAKGYHAVTIAQLMDFVYRGIALPENPVLITFDDGYLSNYELAYPILEELGLCGTIFTIGSSIGHREFYKDTNYPLTPHFGYAEARELLASGVMDIQCHTWDMHQWAPYETGPVIRPTVCPLKGESEADYAAALRADWDHYARQMEQNLGHTMTALAYPRGEYTALTEVLLHDMGIPVTLSTRTDRRNTLLRGLPQSLYALSRWNIESGMSDELFLEILVGKTA